MPKERNLRERGAQVGLRVGAALLAAQMSLGMDRVANADINEPVRYPTADGRLLADAPLRTAGRAVDFTGPHGLEFCGTSTAEPTILTVVAHEDAMNIKVIGNPDVFVDPEDVGGSDYPSRAAAAVEALQNKATELISRTNQLWRRIAVILTRDAVNQDVCDLITDSGVQTAPVAVEAHVEVPKPVFVPTTVSVTECPVNWEMPGLFRTTGVPSVGVTNIDIARPERGFNWRNLPSGMRAFFAEPGGLLVDRNNVPVGDIDEWLRRISRSNGAINWVNPLNQQIFQRTEFSGSLPAKGYGVFHLEEGRVRIPTVDTCLSVDLLQRGQGNRYIMVIKGLNGDFAQDKTAEWDRVVGGNALYQRYDSAAFISADALNDLAAEALKKVSSLTVVGIDTNTRAMMIVERDRGSAAWRWVNANYRGI